MKMHRVSEFIWGAIFVVSIAIITAVVTGWFAGQAALVFVNT